MRADDDQIRLPLIGFGQDLHHRRAGIALSFHDPSWEALIDPLGG